MGYREISLKLPTDYTEEQLRKKIEKKLKIKKFSYRIGRKSLDARKKTDIYWQILVSVSSKQIKGAPPAISLLNIPYRKRTKKAVVVGSGPAGFFCAFVLQKAGFNTTLIERGSDVKKRAEGIREFEKTGLFNPVSNYVFGEGGAGTFSDGKLTSRSKHISQERKFILSTYINAGAPEEIGYMARPHLGTDNLSKIVTRLREDFLNIGGKIFFETLMEDLKIDNQIVHEAITTSGEIEADEFIIAPGLSAYETYRMLIKRGVKFRTKSFAIGCRVEHPQEIINNAQWGQKSLPGVKAAEYHLTSKGNGNLPVYTFCMCPGGSIVPASAYKNTNIVNGMSLYNRNGKFANAACVAGINLDRLGARQIAPLEALDWLGNLERRFYEYSGGFKAPFCGIKDFINREEMSSVVESSYPLGLAPAALWDLLPSEVSGSIREGLKDFSRKIKGFEAGVIMGLDSKSSSPIQVLREENYLCADFGNLYVAGEGSGYSGGIISSAADGIKAAMTIIGKD
ncbi:MAG: NAD(P)-binding protein [Candidatus Omnitrophica bacterium]|nr:NAD(P)-binding protein [Candidatus Omnitrophota bacterium]MBU0878949.1 NAD(P)-binding protein [Candidatus Omnitrophota bacterium]MBU0896728.1 NAD(P)-binding protein [Candidatus Omnitrophota bacterium]MBU1133953.1 NAD(P)-binding protein [Candidatus Omnitrophota bacterium]MBU1809822.1 NAD(P)-binding protein [Candidatus Omnitrophota bacterium]